MERPAEALIDLVEVETLLAVSADRSATPTPTSSSTTSSNVRRLRRVRLRPRNRSYELFLCGIRPLLVILSVPGGLH